MGKCFSVSNGDSVCPNLSNCATVSGKVVFLLIYFLWFMLMTLLAILSLLDLVVKSQVNMLEYR